MDYQKRVDEVKRLLSSLRSSIKMREENSKKGEATYILDSEIRASFTDLVPSYLLRIHSLTDCRP